MKMEAVEVIALLVEQMLPRGSGENKILQIVLRIAETPVSREETMRTVMFLFHRPGNYTKVLFRTALDARDRPEDFKDWEVVSNHDSAWRGDGVEHTLYMLDSEMRRELSNPKYCEFTASFGFSAPKVVEIKSSYYLRYERKFSIEW